MGDSDGEYRFAGTAEAAVSVTARSLQVRIALKLDGDTFSGESIDLFLANRNAG